MTHLLVIGAGAAGIAAAQRLQQAGFEVLILEARNRIGGRAYTRFDLASHPIELGAEFIHGENALTWQLLQQYNLAALPDMANDNYYTFFAGKLGDGQRFYQIPGYQLPEEYESIAIEWTEAGRPEMDMRSMLATWAAEQNMNIHPEAWGLCEALCALDQATNLRNLSVAHFALEAPEGDGTQRFRLRQGYHTLVAKMAAGIKLQLNTPVKRIQWSTSGVTVTAHNGQRYQADAVVITLPLAILQAGDVVFDPPLPTEKQQVIERLGAGHVDKLLMRFDRPLWEPAMGGILTTLDSSLWWRQGWGLAEEAPILTALFGGDAAFRYEALGAEAVPAALEELALMLGSSIKRHFVEGQLVAWGSDPWSKMGYSFTPVGAAGLRRSLAAPVQKVLYFAGEATSFTRFATVHGAIESGWRAADEIKQRTANANQLASDPPSTTIASPVINEDSLLAKKATAAAISLGSP